MSEPSDVRPEVVDAIVGVLKGGDPAAAAPGRHRRRRRPPRRTPTSRSSSPSASKRDRQAQAWELLLTRSYDEPPTWEQIFDDLDPEVHAELGDALRRPARRRAGGVRAPLRGPLGRLIAGPDPAAHDPSVTAPGRLVAGRYRLQSQIGGGGMGTVWLARDELLGREVAIKQVLSPAGADADGRPTSSGSGRCARAGSPPG